MEWDTGSSPILFLTDFPDFAECDLISSTKDVGEFKTLPALVHADEAISAHSPTFASTCIDELSYDTCDHFRKRCTLSFQWQAPDSRVGCGHDRPYTRRCERRP